MCYIIMHNIINDTLMWNHHITTRKRHCSSWQTSTSSMFLWGQLLTWHLSAAAALRGRRAWCMQSSSLNDCRRSWRLPPTSLQTCFKRGSASLSSSAPCNLGPAAGSHPHCVVRQHHTEGRHNDDVEKCWTAQKWNWNVWVHRRREDWLQQC